MRKRRNHDTGFKARVTLMRQKMPQLPGSGQHSRVTGDMLDDRISRVRVR